MLKIIGIDLGTTNFTAVAVLEGTEQIIVNLEGNPYKSSSVLSFFQKR